MEVRRLSRSILLCELIHLDGKVRVVLPGLSVLYSLPKFQGFFCLAILFGALCYLRELNIMWFLFSALVLLFGYRLIIFYLGSIPILIGIYLSDIEQHSQGSQISFNVT